MRGAIRMPRWATRISFAAGLMAAMPGVRPALGNISGPETRPRPITSHGAGSPLTLPAGAASARPHARARLTAVLAARLAAARPEQSFKVILCCRPEHEHRV